MMEIHHRIEINERYPVLRFNFAQNGYKVFFFQFLQLKEHLKNLDKYHYERRVFFKSGFVFKKPTVVPATKTQ